MPDMGPFREALDEKAVDTDCPVCHVNRWNTTEEGLARVTITTSFGNGRSARGFDAFTVVCDNCGLVRFHAADYLMSD